MASPHAAGALALLASNKKPTNATEVYNLYNQVKSAGNYNWIDDSGDGIKEPLLDVSTFAAVLIPTGGAPNTPPVVEISSPADGVAFEEGETIAFAGTATDAEDGNRSNSLIWTSNLSGPIGTGASFSAMLSAGTHTITASVTDLDGSAGSDSVTITVTASTGGGISLSVTAYKVKGVKYADLTWSGATSQNNVDVFRNGSSIATTANDGAYTDGPLGKGGGSATYKVCEAGTTTCSNEVTVSW